MKQNGHNVLIVGGGIAGLCAAVYALKCGYQVEILEMNDMAGGLATSWRRGPYTFETCLHWLLGSKPGGELHAQWQEVFDIEKLEFVNLEKFVRMEDESGDSLTVFTNIDMLEAELVRRAPQDLDAIQDFTQAVRSLAKFRMLVPSGGLADNWLNLLRDTPILPLINKISKLSGREYGNRFADPLLKAFFGNGDMGQLSAIALVFSLAWMNTGNAGYPIGGSQAMIRLIEEKIASLGGKIRFRAKVERIVLEGDTVIGVQLEGGEAILSDWVISAADGHATIFEMLGGKYVDATIRKIYDEMKLFPSYLQVSLGVARDLSDQPPMVTRLLSRTIAVDPGTELNHLSFRFFHYDKTFAPEGKTAVTSFVPTRNFAYWDELRRKDPETYRAEKHRISESVIDVLEKQIPGIREAIEVVDVSTPASVYRYTGNWKGSMEGWLILPGAGFKPLPNQLPGLANFMMVGQWVMPGGGLPAGLMTARTAVKAMCKQDHVPFDMRTKDAEKPEPVGV